MRSETITKNYMVSIASWGSERRKGDRRQCMTSNCSHGNKHLYSVCLIAMMPILKCSLWTFNKAKRSILVRVLLRRLSVLHVQWPIFLLSSTQPREQSQKNSILWMKVGQTLARCSSNTNCYEAKSSTWCKNQSNTIIYWVYLRSRSVWFVISRSNRSSSFSRPWESRLKRNNSPWTASTETSFTTIQ